MLRHRTLGGHSSDESRNHEIEPEDVKTNEAAHESVEHVQSAILHVLAHPVVALLLKAPNHMGGEEPQAEVHPAHNHKTVEDGTDEGREDVYRQLEKGNCKIGYIVQNHHCSANRKHIQRIREEN